MGAASKRAKKVRTGSEFNTIRLSPEIRIPKTGTGIHAWDLDAIREARTEQMLGRFQRPARLAESMRTDSALFCAWLNRLAPQRGLPVILEAANKGARAVRIRDEGEALFGPGGVGIHPDTLSDIDSDLTNHGVAFAINVVTPRPDGTRVDVELKYWPIEFVWYDRLSRTFRTQVDPASISETEACAEAHEPIPYYSASGVPITHGDGRWVVFKKHEYEPWKRDAAVLPGALLWADRAFGVRDRAKASTAHGNAKVVGTMPQGMAIDSEEGRAFLALLNMIASVDLPVGIKPFGAELDYIVNSSQAWQIFKEIIDSDDAAAAKIYLGQDGTTNNSGGNYIKSDVLFGVRNDLVEGNVRCIERGVLTGTIEPWAAMNFGDSALAPRRNYLMPDADEESRQEAVGARNKSFMDAIKVAKESGFDITQEYVDGLAKDYGVRAPVIKVATPIATAVAPPGVQTPPGAPQAPGLARPSSSPEKLS